MSAISGYDQKAEDALTRHFVVQVNIPYERHLFREMVQAEGETIDQFAVRLRRKAQQCDYGEQMEAQIRDQIISRCRSEGTDSHITESTRHCKEL